MVDMATGLMNSDTHVDDLPEVILLNIFTLIVDTRTRNSMSLVCRKWLTAERYTRTSLTLRGNVRDLFRIPSCFPYVTNLDLSLLSPWGSPHPPLLCQFLSRIFPSVDSLTVYARTPETLELLAPHWPALRHVKLVRWHQRTVSDLGSDFVPLFQHCRSLSSLDLSHFYCWSEDLPPALLAYPSVSASLSRLDLLTLSSPEGFKSHELLAITAACPNLSGFLAGCMFDPRYIDFVGDEALLGLASNCPKLSHLHLADTSSLANARGDPDDDGFTSEDARIGRVTLERLFAGLPLLEELVLDVCQNVRDAGPALETLNSCCPRLKSLKIGQFHGICKAIGSNPSGIAACTGLESLCIKNSADLTDSCLMTIALGCPRLAKLELQGCKKITEMGIKNLACVLSQTLVDVKISCCKHLRAACTLRALEPIRSRIRRLHMDCVWDNNFDQNEISGQIFNNFDLNEYEDEASSSTPLPTAQFNDCLGAKRRGNWDDSSKKKKGRCSTEICSDWYRTWDRLQYLSLWIAVGERLSPLHLAGLESCPVLEEIKIKVEGDCRMCTRPAETFGLSSLTRYPQLLKMQLDCGDAIGFALTAPTGQTDLSLWERFYLNGIGSLNLSELDYWPPQDRDVNQRSLTLPAAGLLGECSTLRKLFIHGTASEHFMTFLLRMPNLNLRDVQLREDYYPAPEDDMSTEMRVESLRRFEEALNERQILD